MCSRDGEVCGNLESFKRNLRKRLPDGFLQKHGLEINEIFSVRASARNKSFPYAYFIDATDAELNKKALRSFHGALSNAQFNLNNKIKDIKAGKAKYDEAVEIVEKFQKTRNKFKNTIETNYPGKKFNLADIVLGKESEILKENMKIPEDVYSKKLLNKWADQGLDITGHAKKTGYVMTGAANEGVFTAQDLSRDKLSREKLVKFFKDNNIDCIKGAGGQCNSIADYQKGYNKLVQEAADGKGSAKAIKKLNGFTKSIRALGNVGKWTGYGLLAEAGFMVPFAVGDYAAGKSWKRILGNATDYGFGPILGQSEQEEFEAALPEGSAAVQGEEVLRIGDEMDRMEKQKVNPGYGRIGYRAKAPKQRQEVYEDKFAEYVRNIQPFLRPSPHLEGGQFYDQGLMDKAKQQDIATVKRIADREAKTKERRSAMNEFDEEIFQYKGYAGGGIAGIRRRGAIPPESGPQPQGLENLKYYVTNT